MATFDVDEVSVDEDPSRFGLLLAAAAAVSAVAALLLVSPTGALATLLGAFVLALGVELDSLGVRDVGLLVMLAGPVVAGLAQPPVAPLLVAAVASVLARDVADNAVEIGRQLGTDTPTRRAEAVHAAGTLLVGLATAAVGYAVFVLAGGGQPVTTLVVLLSGALVLLLALRA